MPSDESCEAQPVAHANAGIASGSWAWPFGRRRIARRWAKPMRTAIVAVIWYCTLCSSALGLTVQIAVARTNLQQEEYAFEVSTKTKGASIAFDVSVQATGGEIGSACTLRLARESNDKTQGNDSVQIEFLRSLEVVKSKKVWKGKVTLSRRDLRRGKMYVVFSKPEYRVFSGIRTQTGAVMYKIDLREFTRT